MDGNGDSNGHTVNLDITGGGSTYNVTQSGVNDAVVDADFSGDEHDVDITPRVTKHAIYISAISLSSPTHMLI